MAIVLSRNVSPAAVIVTPFASSTWKLFAPDPLAVTDSEPVRPIRRATS